MDLKCANLRKSRRIIKNQMYKPLSELLEIFRQEQNRDTEPYWRCLTEPTNLEICNAIHAGRLVPWTPGDNSSPDHQGDRSWHIGRIAWLAVNWKSEFPVEVSEDGRVIDGGHRLYAARFRGMETLQTKTPLRPPLAGTRGIE